MRDDENGVRNGRPIPATNGHRPSGAGYPALAPVMTIGDADTPIDLVAVQADDELVTAIGTRPGGFPPGLPGAVHDDTIPSRDARGTDDRLVAMLAAWRAEIDAEPIPELVDLDTAVAAVFAGMQAHDSAARRRRSGRLRQLAPLVAAAAIIVATVTGVGLGSQDAVPGDTLWAIQKVVNPERAESVEAKVAVEGHLQKARTALQTGDTATATQELQAITTQISSVRGQEGQPQLVQEQQFLAAKLVDTPPGTRADLSTPAKSNPAARPTGAPAPPPPPPVGSSSPAPSVAPSSTEPSAVNPDPRRTAPDRASEAVVPSKPGGPGPVLPAPESPAPEVTKAPEATVPPQPVPGPPGGSEGGVDPRNVPGPDPKTSPGPVDQPPPSGAPNGGKPDEGTPSSDTTTASGSAGASVEATATDTTT